MNSIVSEKRFISQTLGVPYENLSQSYLRSETELTTTSVIDFTLQTNKKQGSLVTERLLDLNDEFVITHFTVGLKQISAAAPTVQPQFPMRAFRRVPTTQEATIGAALGIDGFDNGLYAFYPSEPTRINGRQTIDLSVNLNDSTIFTDAGNSYYAVFEARGYLVVNAAS